MLFKSSIEQKAKPVFSLSFLSFHTLTWKIIGFAVLLFLFLMPIVRLISLSFGAEGALSFGVYEEVLTDPATWKSIENTVWITAFSTLLSVVLGVSMAWIMAYVDIRGKQAMQLFIYLPFIIPSYITTLAWVQFFSGSGPLAMLFGDEMLPNLYGMGGIIFVLGISHYPVVYLMSVDVFRKIPRDAEQAAMVSGAGRWTAFRKIIFPMALPGIGSGALLAFLSNLDNFGVPAFLGIPSNIRVLSTYIYEQIIGYGPSAFARAAVLSVMLGVIALAGTIIQAIIVRKSKANETTKRDMEPRYYVSTRSKRLIQASLWSFLLLTSLVPFLAMAATSLIKAYGLSLSWENLSFKNYLYLFTDSKVARSVSNSIMLGLATVITCLFAGTLLAYVRFKQPNLWTRAAEGIVTLPYALPGTVLALSMILMWMQPVPGWYPGVYGTIWILLIAYLTRFLVLQFRGSLTAFSQLDPSMEEAAQTSGASGFTKWRSILLPLLLPGIMSGAFLVFLTALAELTVSSLLWSSGAETIGVMIFSFEQAGYSTYSTAFSTLIVLAILIGGVSLVLFQNFIGKRVSLKND
ncbi:iron ABC transporter permease [Bacillus gobiensis]|uniref:ABC transporter permease n=1 Tax=Bacillus gobiensis TaxID=1441095 RepID=UPI003D1DD0FF